MEQKRISYYGAYGLIVREAKILLTEKEKGPYTGLWDLPGGGIEFGETPVEALIREIQEETALLANSAELLTVLTHNCQHIRDQIEYHFHHVGLLYRISHTSPLLDLTPGDTIRWVALGEIVPDELTPFAKFACSTYHHP